jgi:hypothetical protein
MTMSTLSFKQALRAGPYAWPGGYPMFFLCSDGGSLCPKCARENARVIMQAIQLGAHDGWRVVATDINWEDPDLTCDNCDKPIESAYGDAP